MILRRKSKNTVLFEVHIQPVILTDACSWLILILRLKKKLRTLAWASMAFQIHKDFHSHFQIHKGDYEILNNRRKFYV